MQGISDRKQVDRLKSKLVAIVGHDLRTPLTSILGALSLINSGSLKAKDLLDIAERNGRRLLCLISDPLDLERINARMISFNPRPTDLGTVIRQSVENHRLLSEAKNLAIVWDLPKAPSGCWATPIAWPRSWSTSSATQSSFLPKADPSPFARPSRREPSPLKSPTTAPVSRRISCW